MISKRIDRKPENDNYAGLANYVRDAKHGQHQGHDQLAAYIGDELHDGEKILYSWHAGCLSDNYNLGIKEVLATQALNTRSKKEKTYHLVISFRPEDEDKLTEEVFRDIELSFAKALGFEEHQRHCGVHKNTDNLHLHIAYNMIHPVSLTRHEPYRDFVARDKVCRELEQKYGLFVDNGREKERAAVRTNSRARTMEAQSGQESFISYVQRQIQTVQAGNWQSFHAALAQKGIAYRLRGNGAVFTDLSGKTHCKASSVGKEFSKTALENNYGKFQEYQLTAENTPMSYYDKAPKDKASLGSEHWQRYLTIREERNKGYQSLKEQINADYARVHERFARNFSEIRGAVLTAKDRTRLYAELKLRKKKTFKQLREKSSAARIDFREKYPATWTQYLQREAEKGDETALELLRRQTGRKRLEEQNPLLARTCVKQAIKELAARDSQWKDVQWWISKKGAVVVKLDCGDLREYGDTTYLRPTTQPGANEKLSLAALQFAEVRWGQEQMLDARKQVERLAAGQERDSKLARGGRVR